MLNVTAGTVDSSKGLLTGWCPQTGQASAAGVRPERWRCGRACATAGPAAAGVTAGQVARVSPGRVTGAAACSCPVAAGRRCCQGAGRWSCGRLRRRRRSRRRYSGASRRCRPRDTCRGPPRPAGPSAWACGRGPAVGPGRFQAFAGAFGDEVGQHLIHRGQHVEGEPPGHGGGVDALREHDQVDPALLKQRGDLGEVAHRAGHPGQPGDHELVPAAEMIEAVVPLGSPSELAGGGVSPVPLTARGPQRVELGVVPLRAGGDPRVPVPGHSGKCAANGPSSAVATRCFRPQL